MVDTAGIDWPRINADQRRFWNESSILRIIQVEVRRSSCFDKSSTRERGIVDAVLHGFAGSCPLCLYLYAARVGVSIAQTCDGELLLQPTLC